MTQVPAGSSAMAPEAPVAIAMANRSGMARFSIVFSVEFPVIASGGGLN
jgi:hypothetical protein